MAADACAIAIANQLGLVCDPVAGLVEIPCIKRNASGVVIAFSAADMALAGIRSCILWMMHRSHAGGGQYPSRFSPKPPAAAQAVTKTGKKLKEQVFGKEE